MMNRLAKWLLGRTFTVLVMGEEGSGKTAFIRRLKYPSDNETLPTTSPKAISYIGEMVEYPVNTEWWFREMTASMRDFKPIAQFTLSHDTIVLWMHDCEKEPTLDPVVFAAFLRGMVDAGCRYFWVVLNKQDSLSVSREAVDSLRQSYEAVLWKFGDEVSGRVFGRDSRISSRTGDGVFDILDEMHTAVGKEKINSDNPELFPRAAHDRELSKTTCTAIYEAGPQGIIETAIAEDTTDADTFWTQFLTGTLTAWNHYTYLKAGYFLILSSDETEPAISTAQRYTTHLKRLLESTPGLINKTHDADYLKQTVTTFWIIQLEHAIREYRQATMSQDLPSRSEFPHVLRHSPHLLNRCLWDQYYSYNAIHCYPQTRWKVSDRKPLSLATKFRCHPAIIPFPARGEDRLMRYAFCVVRYLERPDAHAPRGEIVSLALRTLEKSSIQLRVLDSTVPVYSETQAYFWIQVLHAALRSLSLSRKPSASEECTFKDICNMFQLQATDWKEYYSDKTWNSIAARSQFVLPDIKPLPNVILPVRVSHKTSKKQGGKWDEVKLPSTEELSFLAATAVDEAKEVRADLPITSHAQLLFYLFARLTPRPKSKKSTDHSRNRDFDALTLGQAAQGIFTDLSSPAAGALVSAATHRNFWIQQVGVAMLHWAREGQINFDGDGNSTYAEFIASNTHLAFQELPAIYYSAAVWTGSGGKSRETIVQGDRRGLASLTIGAGLGLGEVDGIEIEAGWVAV